MLTLTNVTIRRGARVLFEDASFTIHAGQRVGVTGRNGTGKSSLFAALLKQLDADQGTIAYPPDTVIAHVAQETPADPRSALDYVLDGDEELRAIESQLAEAEKSGDGERQATLYGHYEHIGGFSAQARATALLHGLGFNPGDEHRAVTEFSGGWRMRLNLAQALMCRSDLLLLDEPTNHLDLDAVIWLQDWLNRYPGTLLLISHDRDFLDDVANAIVHLEHRQAKLYPGNYSAFEHIRAEHLAQQQAGFEKQQREMAHIRTFIDRFRAKATKAKQAQSRLKALARFEAIAPAHIDSPFHFSFLAPEKQPNPILELRKTQLGYAEKVIIPEVTISLLLEHRIALLGANGAGKSTFIKTLAGTLPPLDGERKEPKGLKIGYFAQHQLEQLDPEKSSLQHLQRLDPQATDQDLRKFLGGFGFTGEQAIDPVAPFSGGEKARLALALIVYQRPNLLLLDEPTNHLDIEMREALILALQDYEGTLVVVSHDRHLLRTIADDYWLVANGKVQPFDGDLEQYAQWLKQSKVAAGTERTSAEGGQKREQRRSSAERRKQLKPLRDALTKAEKEMERLSAKQAELETALADSTLYEEAHKARLQTLVKEKGELDLALVAAEERWLDASEALEMAEGEG